MFLEEHITRAQDNYINNENKRMSIIDARKSRNLIPIDYRVSKYLVKQSTCSRSLSVRLSLLFLIRDSVYDELKYIEVWDETI